MGASGHTSSTSWGRLLQENYKIRGGAWELMGHYCG